MPSGKDIKIDKNPIQVNLTVNIKEEIRAGVYSNLVSVTTTSNQEVMFDFIYVHPHDKAPNGGSMGQLVSRVILPITVAKAMKLVLDAHLGKTRKE